MFSFHKPKVYRSSAGCCICKAKSSSSRFTDSKKYEDDFMECFQLRERRSGEICNACVLLVKRWKKLPTGSERNWNHVVDARAGPGTKSLTKFKAKNKKKKLKEAKKAESSMKKKHVYLKPVDNERSHSPDADSDDANGEDMSEDFNMPPSFGPSPSPSEDGDGEMPLVKKRRHRSRSPQRKCGTKRRSSPEFSSFLDLKLWKREEVCCGIVFKGPNAAVMIDLNYWKPCSESRHVRDKDADLPEKVEQEEQPKEEVTSPTTNTSTNTSTPEASPEVSPLESHPHPQPLAAPAPLDANVKVIAVAARSETTSANGVVTKTFSDSSSDSGYDESSNQGVESREAALEFANRSHLQPVEIRAD